MMTRTFGVRQRFALLLSMPSPPRRRPSVPRSAFSLPRCVDVSGKVGTVFIAASEVAVRAPEAVAVSMSREAVVGTAELAATLPTEFTGKPLEFSTGPSDISPEAIATTLGILGLAVWAATLWILMMTILLSKRRR